MSRTPSSAPSLVRCPKCGGGRILRQFLHVEGGVCFMCMGKGVVSEWAAQAHERREFRSAVKAMQAETREWEQEPPSRMVDLGLEFVPCGATITRVQHGFQCEIPLGVKGESYPIVYGYFVARFTVEENRIVMGEVSEGIARYRDEIRAALQRKLRVTA